MVHLQDITYYSPFSSSSPPALQQTSGTLHLSGSPATPAQAEYDSGLDTPQQRNVGCSQFQNLEIIIIRFQMMTLSVSPVGQNVVLSVAGKISSELPHKDLFYSLRKYR